MLHMTAYKQNAPAGAMRISTKANPPNFYTVVKALCKEGPLICIATKLNTFWRVSRPEYEAIYIWYTNEPEKTLQTGLQE